MSGIFRFFAKPPVSGFVALLLLIGALFALRLYTEISDTIFWLALAGLVALWAAMSGLWWFLQRRKRARFSAEAAPPPDPSAAMVGDEQRKLQGKFTDAMRQLSTLRVKGRRGGSRYLYELPWYIFIGPPGAGKTEALKNCGLDFPLRREGDPIDIEGGGGTANCNWVITDEAVFIDTAGRYTTRSSNETVDGAAWRNFLGLLSRHRPREPINGVIVAIGLTDLMGGDGAALARNAEAVRERLKELYEETKARIPVYVIFTKADLLVGFNETFQAMRAEERRQVWGATFTGESEAEMRAALDGFGGEFDALVARLGEYQLRRLHEERDTLVRGKIFSFSAQFSSMKPAIEQFLRRAFEPNRFGDPAWLRGVYFTSATQFGQPIDRLMEAMARDFGVERKAVALTPPGAGRSYFLEHLLSKVVFPEAGLVTRTVRRGPPYARYAAIAACAVAAGLAGVGVMRMQAYNAAQAKAFEASIGDYNAALANEETAFIDTGDPRPILPALDIRRDEWMRLRDVTPPLPFGLFMDQTAELRQRAQDDYRHALNALLRPRLLHRFEREVARGLGDPAGPYNALKAYLLIGGVPRSNLADNVDFLTQRIAASLGETLGGASGRDAFTRLFGADGAGGHVGVWLETGALSPWRGESDPDLDGELVKRAQDALDVDPARRALESMAAVAEKYLPDWAMAEEGGRSLGAALIDLEGGTPNVRIPAIYTKRGFYEYFLPNAEREIAKIRDESWVTGASDDQRQSDAEIFDRLERLYYDEYVRVWRAALAGLRVKPFSDAQSANVVLGALKAHSESPLRKILTAAARETALDVAPEAGAADVAGAAASKEFDRVVGESLQRRGALGRIVDAARGGRAEGGGQAPGAEVAKAFAELRAFSEGPELQDLLDRLDALRAAITSAEAMGQTSPLASMPEAFDLKAAADSAPPPVDQMLSAMLEYADTTTASGARARMNALWRSEVSPRCAALDGAYPFGAGAPVSLGDLQTVLGNGGLIETFFNTHLSALVDRSKTPWRWRPAGLALGVPPDRLQFFQNAATLRRVFFADGSGRPGFEMTVRAGEMEAGVGETAFSVGGAPAKFTPEDMTPKALQWPGYQSALGAEISVSLDPVAQTDAVLTIAPEPAARVQNVAQSGAWGLFKLADAYQFRPVDGGRSGRLRMAVGGRIVVIELGFASEINPFTAAPILRGFKCPEGL